MTENFRMRSDASDSSTPAADGHSVSPRAGLRHESSAPRRLDHLRVLLVEDSPDNQVLFSRMLEGAGATVALATNGQEAVDLDREAARTHSEFDAVVMDIRMPVMDGYQATRRIRERGYQGPIIALTAHAVPGEEERCRAQGCSHFLTKPVERRVLIETVLAACVKMAAAR